MRPPAEVAFSERCVSTPGLCVVGEQLILPHNATAKLRRRLRTLLGRVHSPFDYHTNLFAGDRPTVLANADGASYRYLPMAVVQPIRNRTERQKFLTTQSAFELPQPRGDGLIFFTCWPSNPAEVFHRTVTLLHTIWPLVARERSPALVPATWNPRFEYWLAPWLNAPASKRLKPMAPMPSVRDPWRLHTAKSAHLAHRYEQNAKRARAPPRCFARASVCDLSQEGTVAGLGRHAPWAAMQAVMHHFAPATPPPPPTTAEPAASCVLRVAFVERHRRRRLANLEDLIAACNRWHRGHVSCSSISFGRGLPPVAQQLRGIDVLVSPHGADAIHALALRRGAWLLEVMPIHNRPNCPCDVFRALLGAEKAVHYLRLSTTNRSYAAVPTVSGRANVGTMHADLRVPWEAVRAALEAIAAGTPTAEALPDATQLGASAAGWRLLTSAGGASEERAIKEQQNRNFQSAAIARRKRMAEGKAF